MTIKRKLVNTAGNDFHPTPIHVDFIGDDLYWQHAKLGLVIDKLDNCYLIIPVDKDGEKVNDERIVIILGDEIVDYFGVNYGFALHKGDQKMVLDYDTMRELYDTPCYCSFDTEIKDGKPVRYIYISAEDHMELMLSR